MTTFLVTIPYVSLTLTARPLTFGESILYGKERGRIKDTKRSMRYLVDADSGDEARLVSKEWFDTRTKYKVLLEVPQHIAAERAERARLRLQKKERGF